MEGVDERLGDGYGWGCEFVEGGLGLERFISVAIPSVCVCVAFIVVVVVVLGFGFDSLLHRCFCAYFGIPAWNSSCFAFFSFFSLGETYIKSLTFVKPCRLLAWSLTFLLHFFGMEGRETRKKKWTTSDGVSFGTVVLLLGKGMAVFCMEGRRGKMENVWVGNCMAGFECTCLGGRKIGILLYVFMLFVSRCISVVEYTVSPFYSCLFEI